MGQSRADTGKPDAFDIHEDAELASTTVEVGMWDDESDREETAAEPEENNEKDSSDTEDEVTSAVAEDIAKFEETFKDIGKKYRLIGRIGEGMWILHIVSIIHWTNIKISGTFSTVYKAEDLQYNKYLNDWDIDNQSTWIPPMFRRKGLPLPPPKKHYVAIKKIYVTSSPARIQNELELLWDLQHCNAICPLITAFRHLDQVVAILPYYKHRDFREFYREMVPSDMQPYFRSLFTALEAVHTAGILHRDIKPTNFLYDPERRRGVLVDFGLAERDGTDSSYCFCQDTGSRRRSRLESSWAATNAPPQGYPKNDTRPSRRANRAGTRGFRAPEVLFKCGNQTTKIDIWSVGVILLTILAQRFPFFNSTDDVEALVEMASIFGRKRLHSCAVQHGCCFDCTLPSVGEKGFSFEKLILWSTCKDKFSPGEVSAIRLLERCLDLDPKKRIDATEALHHEFLLESTVFDDDEDADDEINMVGA